jgi:hypothetical protein
MPTVPSVRGPSLLFSFHLFFHACLAATCAELGSLPLLGYFLCPMASRQKIYIAWRGLLLIPILEGEDP